MAIDLADSMTDGWKLWADWIKEIAPENQAEIQALEADKGKFLGYVRMIGRRREDAVIEDPITSISSDYKKTPLLRCPKG